MTKKPFQEQLSKFSLLGELPKAKNGLEEAWGNLKKCNEPFTAKDIIKQQQETINRQQAEIERLEIELKAMRGAANSYKAEFEKLQVRLRKERHQFDDVAKTYSEIKAEAIKEFALRLKGLSFQTYKGYFAYEITAENLNNLVKEMVGDSQCEQ